MSKKFLYYLMKNSPNQQVRGYAQTLYDSFRVANDPTSKKRKVDGKHVHVLDHDEIANELGQEAAKTFADLFYHPESRLHTPRVGIAAGLGGVTGFEASPYLEGNFTLNRKVQPHGKHIGKNYWDALGYGRAYVESTDLNDPKVKAFEAGIRLQNKAKIVRFAPVPPFLFPPGMNTDVGAFYHKDAGFGLSIRQGYTFNGPKKWKFKPRFGVEIGAAWSQNENLQFTGGMLMRMEFGHPGPAKWNKHYKDADPTKNRHNLGVTASSLDLGNTEYVGAGLQFNLIPKKHKPNNVVKQVDDKLDELSDFVHEKTLNNEAHGNLVVRITMGRSPEVDYQYSFYKYNDLAAQVETGYQYELPVFSWSHGERHLSIVGGLDIGTVVGLKKHEGSDGTGSSVYGGFEGGIRLACKNFTVDAIHNILALSSPGVIAAGGQVTVSYPFKIKFDPRFRSKKRKKGNPKDCFNFK